MSPEVGQKFLLLTHLTDRASNQKLPAILDEIYKQTLNAVAKGKPMTPEEKRAAENINVNTSITPRTPFAWFAAGYYNLKIRNFSKAFELFNGTPPDLNYQSYDYSLPYAVWAGVKTGRASDVEMFLNKYKNENGSNFDYYLASAFLSAERNDHKEAIQHLRAAQYNLPDGTGNRPVYIWYELVEICEWLYQDTNYPGYKDLALMLAKICQRTQPMMGWAYAVEAKYSDSESDQIRALAIALYLDRRSERISKFSDQEKKKALKWLEQNNPFLPKNSEKLKSEV